MDLSDMNVRALRRRLERAQAKIAAGETEEAAQDVRLAILHLDAVLGETLVRGLHCTEGHLIPAIVYARFRDCGACRDVAAAHDRDLLAQQGSVTPARSPIEVLFT